jgi:aminoglycoside phosphotransferase (APT) family kinase protein
VTTDAGGILNLGHDDRLVQRCEIDGVAVIRKRYLHADAAAVFTAMAALWSSPFGAGRTPPGMPEPLRLHDDRGGMDMSVVDGPMLGARGDLGALPAHVDELARLLADLHTSGVTVPRRRTAARLVASLERKFEGGRHDVLDHLALRAPLLDEALVVSHGDFSPRNVVVTPMGLRLIDFDRLQMAGAGRDVQYLAAWAWVTDVVSCRAPRDRAWTVGDHFQVAYAARRPEVADELMAGRAFHRASSLVRIAMSWSSLRHDSAATEVVLAEAMRQLHDAHG